jgi:hypothetical protein
MSPRVSEGVACADFGTRNTRKHFFRASGRFGNTSHSRVMGCGLHSIAYSSRQET